MSESYTLEQMKEHRRLWVEALRSGKYKQGMDCLRTDADEFCCLGVLADIAGCEWDDGKADGESDNAPLRAMKFVGLQSQGGGFAGIVEGYGALWGMNDDGVAFDEIADLIESNPPGLFIDSMEDAQ